MTEANFLITNSWFDTSKAKTNNIISCIINDFGQACSQMVTFVLCSC